jgi:hypothetical protein
MLRTFCLKNRNNILLKSPNILVGVFIATTITYYISLLITENCPKIIAKLKYRLLSKVMTSNSFVKNVNVFIALTYIDKVKMNVSQSNNCKLLYKFSKTNTHTYTTNTEKVEARIVSCDDIYTKKLN